MAESRVAWFTRDSITGALSYIDRHNTDISATCSVIVSPDGKHVYVVNGSAVAWFIRDSITGYLNYTNKYSDADIAGASSVIVSPDGKHVYVSAINTDAVAWFVRDY